VIIVVNYGSRTAITDIVNSVSHKEPNHEAILRRTLRYSLSRSQMPCILVRSALKKGSIEMLKRRGAKGSPCGTPCLMGKGELSLPLIKTEVCL
jgi:hypothetical protein